MEEVTRKLSRHDMVSTTALPRATFFTPRPRATPQDRVSAPDGARAIAMFGLAATILAGSSAMALVFRWIVVEPSHTGVLEGMGASAGLLALTSVSVWLGVALRRFTAALRWACTGLFGLGMAGHVLEASLVPVPAVLAGSAVGLLTGAALLHALWIQPRH